MDFVFNADFVLGTRIFMPWFTRWWSGAFGRERL